MKKLNKYGYTKIEIFVIVMLLGVVAFITINKTSYAFARDNTSDINEFKKLIEIQAEDYASLHLELFDEASTNFIRVSDLIDAGYLTTNQEGLLTNPTDNKKSYNDSKIKLEYTEEENKVVATLVD